MSNEAFDALTREAEQDLASDGGRSGTPRSPGKHKDCPDSLRCFGL